MSKVIKFEEDARDAVLKGINTTVDLTKKTLGGKGRVVMIDTPGDVHPTMDGVTVIKHVAMNNPVEDMGVKLAIECAEKQVAENGDGTTSVSIMFQALANAGNEKIAEGHDANRMTRELEEAADTVVNEIENIATKIDRNGKEIFQVAKVSAHGDEEIASLVQEVIQKTTEDSELKVAVTPYDRSYVDVVTGFKAASGWLSEKFITDDRNMTAQLENPYVLIYQGKINSFQEIAPLIIRVNEEGRSLVIVSDDLNGDALSTIAVNNEQGKLSAVAINPYGHSREDQIERLKDLAIATGGIVVSPDSGHRLEEVTLDMLGECDKVGSSQKETIFIGGKANDGDLKERISNLKHQLKEETEVFPKELLKGRIAALDGSFGVIYIGGTIAAEVKEKKDRADDALGSAQAALKHGIVPGGGVSLLRAREALKTHTLGEEILYNSLSKPFMQIMVNAGLDADKMVHDLKEQGQDFGYDVVNEEFTNMVERGIIDPAKVEMSVVKNSVATVVQFLRMGGLICRVND